MDAVTPVRRTQAERRAESGDRLLAAAAEIIAHEGYLAATLERVGERAGFSRALASRRYGSKDGLIEAVIWRVSAHVHEQVDLAVAEVEDPLDQLLGLFDRFIVLVMTDTSVRAYFVLFSAMIANRLETVTVFEAVQARFGARVERLIMEARDRGRVAADTPPGHAAFMVCCLLAGIAVESGMGVETAPSGAGELRRDLLRMIRRALGAA